MKLPRLLNLLAAWSSRPANRRHTRLNDLHSVSACVRHCILVGTCMRPEQQQVTIASRAVRATLCHCLTNGHLVCDLCIFPTRVACVTSSAASAGDTRAPVQLANHLSNWFAIRRLQAEPPARSSPLLTSPFFTPRLHCLLPASLYQW